MTIFCSTCAAIESAWVSEEHKRGVPKNGRGLKVGVA